MFPKKKGIINTSWSRMIIVSYLINHSLLRCTLTKSLFQEVRKALIRTLSISVSGEYLEQTVGITSKSRCVLYDKPALGNIVQWLVFLSKICLAPRLEFYVRKWEMLSEQMKQIFSVWPFLF